MGKKKKYKPVKHDVIDIELALNEFSRILQYASKRFSEQKKYESMLLVAGLWLELIKIIDTEEPEKPASNGIGFGLTRSIVERGENESDADIS